MIDIVRGLGSLRCGKSGTYTPVKQRELPGCGVQSVVSVLVRQAGRHSGLVGVNEVRPCIKTQKVKKKNHLDSEHYRFGS